MDILTCWLRFQIALTVTCLAACGSAPGEITPLPSRAAVSERATPTRWYLSPPAPAPTSTPPASPVDARPDLAPFRYADSVADLLSKPESRVQLVAPEDGSIWMLSLLNEPAQSVARWEAEDGQILLLRDEGTQVAIDRTGRAWVLKPEGTEIEVWDRGQWAVQGLDRGWIAGPPIFDMWLVPLSMQVASDAQGRTWLATRSEVRVFDGDRWSVYTREDLGLPEPDREQVVIDATIAVLDEGAQTWVGDCYLGPSGPYGGGGLRWFDGISWEGEQAPPGETCVSVLRVDPGGDLWIGVQDAIWRYQPDGERWTMHQLPEASQFGFNYNQPYDMLIDQDGDTWIIVELCGGAHCYAASYLYRIQRGEGALVKESSPWDGHPQQLLSGADGRNWLLWGGVFYQILEGDLVPILPLDARGMITDPTGRVWALVGEYEQATLWVLDTTPDE